MYWSQTTLANGDTAMLQIIIRATKGAGWKIEPPWAMLLNIMNSRTVLDIAICGEKGTALSPPASKQAEVVTSPAISARCVYLVSTFICPSYDVPLRCNQAGESRITLGLRLCWVAYKALKAKRVNEEIR